ncbi:chromosomal replication initiator protein DnaA [Georgenia sp. Z1491]|uniref:chromosomal replication initiator protein DnaA n=1 Tax=Georgenia sp. Z1491 TaxID=3416707 RepID=UPI003CF74CEE
MATSIAEAWQLAVSQLSDSGDIRPAQLAFVRQARALGIIDDTLLLAVGSDLAKDYLEMQAREQIVAAMSRVHGSKVRFAVTVDPSLLDEPTPQRPVVTELPVPPSAATPARPPSTGTAPAPEETPARSAPDRSSQSRGTSSVEDNGDQASRLNPKFTFETFVSGSSNRFAHAAATAVAESPAKAYNPLFIYGGSGLGKTHLLHSIGHYARNLYPGIRVRYVNSEEFTNDFINSIRDDKAESFQRRYRNVDVLLIDDIQFLGGKEQTVEEFFHTFNTLHNDSKQVVITSDVAPKQLSGFEQRLVSRFEWGLLTDVQPPDLETRIAILRKKAENDRLDAAPEVLEYIASRISTNIRELEGALIRVTAFANLNRQHVDRPLAEMVLKDIITDPESEEITPSLIMAQTADYFSISLDALTSADRSRVLVTARQIAMYLCRELTPLSLPKIGQLFGGRDHTTVMHANRKIKDLMAEKRQVYNQVSELTARIKNRAREG